MWQADEDLFFTGRAKRLGLAASSKKLEYNARLLERWEPEEAVLISSGEFEHQFTTFTMRVFYSFPLP